MTDPTTTTTYPTTEEALTMDPTTTLPTYDTCAAVYPIPEGCPGYEYPEVTHPEIDYTCFPPTGERPEWCEELENPTPTTSGPTYEGDQAPIVSFTIPTTVMETTTTVHIPTQEPMLAETGLGLDLAVVGLVSISIGTILVARCKELTRKLINKEGV